MKSEAVLQAVVCVLMAIVVLAVGLAVALHIRAYQVRPVVSPTGTGQPRERILDEEFVAGLPRVSAVRPVSNEACPVCIEDFDKTGGAAIIELPCLHYFHEPCITPWLYHRSPLCPLCKVDVRAPPPLRVRLSTTMNNWREYVRSVALPMVSFRHGLEPERDTPPGAFQ